MYKQDKNKIENKEVIAELAERLANKFDSKNLNEETKKNIVIGKRLQSSLKEALRSNK